MSTSASTPEPSSNWIPTSLSDDESSLSWFAYDSTNAPLLSSGGPDLPCVCTLRIDAPCAVCCDSKITATATAESENGCGGLAYVQIMAPDGTIAEGVGSATITYLPKQEDCGTTVKFTAGASCQNGISTADVDVVKATFDAFTVSNGNPPGTQWQQIQLNGVPGMRLSLPVEYQGSVSLNPAPDQLCGPQYELKIMQWVAATTVVTYKNGRIIKIEDGPMVDAVFNEQSQPSDYTDGVLAVQASDQPGASFTDAQLDGQQVIAPVNPPIPLGIPVVEIEVTYNFTSALYIRCTGEAGSNWRYLSQINWKWVAEVARQANGQWPANGDGTILPHDLPIDGTAAPEPNNGPTLPELQ